MTAHQASEETVHRPLGGFERIAFAYAQRRPYQFCLVARFGEALTADRLVAALAAVQASHPMLGVGIRDGGAGELPVFCAHSAPIPMRVAEPSDDWSRLAGEEVTRRIHPDSAPLLRATLMPDPAGSSCRVALTICHAIADGGAALQVIGDLARALGGERLEPHSFPKPQESFAGTLAADAAASSGPADSGDPVDPRPPRAVRPFDGRPPEVAVLELDENMTEALRDAAQRHAVSVHSVLCAAATRVLAGAERPIVNIGTAVDLRRAAGLPSDVADRFFGVHTVHTVADADDLWALAAENRRRIAAATSAPMVDAALRAMGDLDVVSPDDAEMGMRLDTHADVLLTNLGAIAPATGEHTLSFEIEGGVLVMHIEGEQILSVVTSGGRLRLVHVSHDPIAHLLSDLRRVLREMISGEVQDGGR